MARLCAATLHLALEPAGVAHAVCGFTSRAQAEVSFDDLDARAAAGERFEGYARVDLALKHIVFKDFDEDARPVTQVREEAENLDGEAVAWASEMLSARPERQRVLLVLSDGHPEGWSHRPTERAWLREQVRRAEAHMTVVGLGIASDAVERYYRHAIVVRDVEELPGALLRVLGAVLAGTG